MSDWQRGLRDFLTHLGSWLRRNSEVAGEWIDEQAAITQRVRAIRKLRGDQQQALGIIGAKVYSLHTLGKVRNKDVLVDCQRIDEILARLERLKQEIEEIKRRSTRPEIKLIQIEDDEPLTEPGDEEIPAPVEKPAPAKAGAPAPAEPEAPAAVEPEAPQDEPSASVEVHDL
jgi:hypothetical protein